MFEDNITKNTLFQEQLKINEKFLKEETYVTNLKYEVKSSYNNIFDNTKLLRRNLKSGFNDQLKINCQVIYQNDVFLKVSFLEPPDLFT